MICSRTDVAIEGRQWCCRRRCYGHRHGEAYTQLQIVGCAVLPKTLSPLLLCGETGQSNFSWEDQEQYWELLESMAGNDG